MEPPACWVFPLLDCMGSRNRLHGRMVNGAIRKDDMDKLKLKESQKRKIRATYPLIVNMVKRKGYIAPRDEVVKTFGEEAIQMAINENIIKDTKIIKRYRDNSEPPHPVRVLVLPEYDKSRPEWLDGN
jgi:hypothetical protein